MSSPSRAKQPSVSGVFGQPVQLFVAAQMVLLALWAFLRLRTIANTTFDGAITGDVDYYHQSLAFSPNYDVLSEYPVPAVGLLRFLHWLAHANGERFFMIFTVACLVADLAMLWGLLRRSAQIFSGNQNAGFLSLLGPVTWVTAVTFMAPLAYHRLDLFTAVLAGLAVLYVTRPSKSNADPLSDSPSVPALSGAGAAIAGILLGAAAMLKLWPLALVPLLMAISWRASNRVAAYFFGGFAGSAGLLTLWAINAGGLSRFLNPIFNQGERGLQAESVWATWGNFSRLHDPVTHYHVFEYGALHLHGPTVSAALLASRLSTLLGAVVIIWLAWRLLPRDRRLFPAKLTWLSNRGDLAEVAAAKAELAAAPAEVVKVDDVPADHSAQTERPAAKAGKGKGAAKEGHRPATSAKKSSPRGGLTKWLAQDEATTMAVLSSMAVGLVLVSSSVLSTQFLLWLFAPLAVLVTVSHRRPLLQVGMAVSAGVLSYLTNLVYPVHYWKFISLDAAPITEPIGVWVFVIRNVLLVLFTTYLCVVAFFSTSRRGHKP
ncbi:MAG: glycosyltransferase family 87 protein [Buchananella hordeovulneris]|nr:glycosyltransferase family 87 protein [Buchananella hordeovulneris]